MQEPQQSSRSETTDTFLVSSTLRASGELGISQSSAVSHLYDLGKKNK